MNFSTTASTLLRELSTLLRTPVMIVLLLLIALVIVILGSLIVEYFTEHRLLKADLPNLVDTIKLEEVPLRKVIIESGLLRRQKLALLELTKHSVLDEDTLEALAGRLIYQERMHYQRILLVSEIVEKLGPIFGLLGTLIPLGPGIQALANGDTATLSASMLTAFDTTVAGLIAAAVAFLITIARKRWYSDYMSSLELVVEAILGRSDLL